MISVMKLLPVELPVIRGHQFDNQKPEQKMNNDAMYHLNGRSRCNSLILDVYLR